MYIVKNALRNLLRSKGRNILIGLIVLVIALSSCLALSIRAAASKARESGLDGMQITAQLTFDRQSMMQNIQQSGGNIRQPFQGMMTSLTLEEMQTYAGSSYVKDFTYTITTSVDAGEGLEAVDMSSSDSTADTGNTPTDMPGNQWSGKNGGGRGPMTGMGTQGDFTLIGYSGENAMTSFLDGTCRVTDGEIFEEGTAEALCLISDELATLNGLSTGDTIQLANPNDETELFAFTIAGIYHNDAATADMGGGMRGFSTADDPANQILTSYNALKKIVDASAAAATTSTDETTGLTGTTALREQTAGVYYFADVASFEAFQEDAAAMGLPNGYTFTSTDVESYEQSLVPLQNLSQFAAWFLVVVLLIGGVILVVFHIFNIRERKYEIGVLTAIGMRKRKVAAQFLVELFTVTFVFLLVGTAVGAAVSVPVTNALLSNQIASQDTRQNNREQAFGRPGSMGMGMQDGGMPGGADMPDGEMFGRGNGAQGGRFSFMRPMTNYLSEVSSATDWLVVVQLLGIGLLLTLVSAMVAAAFVMRYEPLKILSERN